MQNSKVGGENISASALTPSPSLKAGISSASMLTPSEVEFLRQDKAQSLEYFAALQRTQVALRPLEKAA
jgi:hypothetical protein